MPGRKLPPCFNEKVVAEIWGEVLGDDYGDVLLTAIMDGKVLPTADRILDFVQASLEYPHFAAAKDLCPVLKISVGAAHNLIYEVKKRAREQRP